ncbi:sulfite exporter TauE/SafE family protein [Campylobacter geochelonis]|uniref:Probable membrane transporter protein n=1 Tax=Campylobacter geochelonis TaxID=1780362 RepID=A0A128E9Z0_9BACT|nr:sulfite exporter TauE/SafE family protein [Campylobacter geochelonis]CZE45836.1 Cpp22 [Campylobacter geochelonis]
MEILHFIEFAIFGTIVGIVSGFFGIGGGTIVVPSMLFLGYDIKAAVGISIMQMLFSSIFGSYVNYKTGKLKMGEGVLVGVGGLCGAGLSGFIVSNVAGIWLKIGLLLILFICIAKMFFSTKQAQKHISSKLLLFILGAFIGAFGTSMGIGGGVLLVPILVGFLGYDIKKAVSMSLFFVIFSSFGGFLSLASHGLVEYKSGAMLGICSLVGVYFGVKFCHKVGEKLQKRLLLGMYVLMFLITLEKTIVG